MALSVSDEGETSFETLAVGGGGDEPVQVRDLRMQPSLLRPVQKFRRPEKFYIGRSCRRNRVGLRRARRRFALCHGGSVFLLVPTS